MKAQDVIETLDLAPLPDEGGFFRETHRSAQMIPAEVLPAGYEGPRPVSTAILYLITPTSFSRLHTVRSEEVYHFHAGDPARMLLISPTGEVRRPRLGPDLAAGDAPQVVVPAGWVQGTRLEEGGSWALMSTTVSPGFEFADYGSGADFRDQLAARHPDLADELDRFWHAETSVTAGGGPDAS